MSKIYCSTGVMVGRINNNDYTLIAKHFPNLLKKGLIDGGEFMFAGSFYDKLDDIYSTLSSIDVPFDVIHCDKEIGVMLSECDDELSEKALKMLEINCSFGKKIGAKKGVFHLWGSRKSDTHIEYNLSFLPRIIDIFKKINRLIVEFTKRFLLHQTVFGKQINNLICCLTVRNCYCNQFIGSG